MGNVSKTTSNWFSMDKNENLSKCNEKFDFPKELFILHKDLPFLPESKKPNKVEKLICRTGDKKNMLFT